MTTQPTPSEVAFQHGFDAHGVGKPRDAFGGELESVVKDWIAGWDSAAKELEIGSATKTPDERDEWSP